MTSFVPPMTMADFLQASRGTWLNRRSIHHLDHQDDEAADSNLVIEPFDASDPVVQRVCDALQVATDRAAGGGRFWWESNLKKEVRNDDYAAIIVVCLNRAIPARAFCFETWVTSRRNRL